MSLPPLVALERVLNGEDIASSLLPEPSSTTAQSEERVLASPARAKKASELPEEVLFHAQLPVCVSQDASDDVTRELTLRVSVKAPNSRDAMLLLCMSDENDADLLLHAELREREFHVLKLAQSLLVDFHAFPDMIVQLVKRALREHTQRTHGFLVCLKLHKVGACFSLVESNNFRKLQHLAVELRAATGPELRTHLAKRGLQFRTVAEQLASQLKDLRSQFAALQLDHRSLQEKALLSDARHRELLASTRAEHSAAMADLKSQHSTQLRSLEQEHTQRIQQMQHQHQHAMDTLQANVLTANKRRDEALSEIEKLQTTCDIGERKIRETSLELEQLRDELQQRREQCSSQSKQIFDLEQQVQQLKLREAALTQQVADARELAEKTQSMLSVSEKHRNDLAESLAEQRRLLERAEHEKSSESSSRQQAEQQSTLKEARVKALEAELAARDAVLAKQEAAQRAASQELAQAKLETERAQDAAKAREDELERLQQKLVSQGEKLRKSKQLIESNQEVISWLNKEISQVQIQHNRRNITSLNFRPRSSRNTSRKSAGTIQVDFDVDPSDSLKSSSAQLIHSPVKHTHECFDFTVPPVPPPLEFKLPSFSPKYVKADSNDSVTETSLSTI
ncbi:MAG: hypothetical protein MHM6MM_006309 [Cercozoa sp. M6MM]